jgi:hypothetical protein
VSARYANAVAVTAAAVPRPLIRREPVTAAPAERATLAETITLIATILVFAISPTVLFLAGLNYEATGGNALEKIHPGTFLYLLAFLLFSLRNGNPFVLLGQLVWRYPFAAVFFAAWSGHITYVVAFLKVPFTPLIDTFLLPILVLWTLGLSRHATRERFAILLHVLMTLNALIGIAEVATGWRLTPFLVAGIEIPDDWRATALFGHPLANACLGGAYMLALATGGGKLVPRWMLPGIFMLQLISMNAFGGRAALVMSLIGLVLVGGVSFTRFLNGGKARLAEIAIIAVLVPGLVVAGLAVFHAGYLDRMLERFVEDKGSASTRIAMFNLFDEIPLQDIFVGPDPNLINALKAIEGLEFGIESFWVGFTLNYGLGASLIFFVGLFAFFLQLIREARPGAILMVVYFLGVVSTSVSISAKTVILAQFAMMVLVLLERDATGQARGDASG